MDKNDAIVLAVMVAVFAGGAAVGLYGWLGVLIAGIAALTYGLGFLVGDM